MSLSSLPDGVKADELASNNQSLPQLTLSPRSMTSDDPDSKSDGEGAPEEGNAGDSQPAVQQHGGRGRSTTIHQTPQSPNARSQSISVADGNDTQGTINQHPATSASFNVGVASDRNKKCRRTMEDAHAFIYDFGGIPGQGYFAVFDGHAGKHAAEWCGAHFHEYLLTELDSNPESTVPDVFNSTFHNVDSELSKLAAANNTHSGCTAVTAFIRVEDNNGKPVAAPSDLSLSDSKGDEADASESSSQQATTTTSSSSSSSPASSIKEKRRSSGGSSREKLMSLLTRGSRKGSPASSRKGASSEKESALAKSGLKRVLYTANVGDARAILCRGGKAVRLTYDHKGSDSQEAKRITDAGGFVMNNRVNGILAVTRSLGDSSMKDFVVGSPYTTETTIGPEDEWLVVACDGLWDVCEDQEAADLLCKGDVADAQKASEVLLEFALGRFSSDNVSVVVVKL